jgi:hypothetical protein
MGSHVYFYTHLDNPFDAAAAAIAGSPAEWLPYPAAPAGDEWQVDLVAEGALPAPVARRRVVVRAEDPVGDETLLLRRITWRAEHADHLFPVLVADLELVPLAGAGCHLSFLGSYRAPLAAVGEVGDRLIGHRIAEACVRRFLLDVADRLAQDVRTAASPPGRPPGSRPPR